MAPGQDPPRDAQDHLGEDGGGGSPKVVKEGDQKEVEHHVGDQAPAGGPRERFLVVGCAEGTDEGVVDEADRQRDGKDAQRRFRLRVQEHRGERMGQHEQPDRDRPTHDQQSLEEAADRVGQLLRALAEINREHGEHDREQRHRNEQQRLEGLVRSGIPARLDVGAESVEDWLVDLEIEDREHERERERQSLEEPLAQHFGLELPTDGGDLSPVEDDHEVRAAEGVLRRVGPHEIRDAGADLDADQHESEKDGALQHDRDRFVAQALNGVEGVAEQRRIGREDHEHEPGHEQAAQARDGQGDGQDDEAAQGHHKPQRHHVAQVALDLAWVPGALANVEDVEAEVQDHADDGRVVDESDEGSIRRGHQLFQGCYHGHERDQARHHLRRQHQDGVAQGPRAHSRGHERSFSRLFDICQFAAMLTPGPRTVIPSQIHFGPHGRTNAHPQRNAPRGPVPPRQLPGSGQELGRAAKAVRMLLLRRRLPRADDRA